MGKNKDFAHISPVENYRKQIGKQDYKKSKTEMKEIKAKAQAKQGISDIYRGIVIAIGAMVAVMGTLYSLLYIYLEKKNEIEQQQTTLNNNI